MLLVFVVCALLPVSVNSWLSYRSASARLVHDGEQALRDWAKNFGLTVFERLRLAEIELEIRRDPVRVEFAPRGALDDIGDPFRSVERWSRAEVEAAWVDLPVRHDDPSELLERLNRGQSVLWPEATPRGVEFLMARPYDPRDASAGALVGRLEVDYLWTDRSTGEATDERSIFILDADGQQVAHIGSSPDALPPSVSQRIPGVHSWSIDGRDFVAAVWALPIRYQFGSPHLFIVVLEPREALVAAVTGGRGSFLLVALATLGFVGLLATGQIRRSLGPLDGLVAGARGLAAGDLSTRVDIRSRDEFRDVGTAFNEMAERVEDQFAMLSTVARVDRALLSSVDIESIAFAVLDHVVDGMGMGGAALAVLLPGPEREARVMTRVGSDSSTGPLGGTPFPFLGGPAGSGAGRFQGEEEWPSWLAKVRGAGLRARTEEVVLEGRVVALLIATDGGQREPAEAADGNLRQLADQVGVALSKAYLVRDLQAIKDGALLAMARGVDAKSSWTAGHSERVTALALEIGRELGLRESELERLQRGGLLHDIGKIGVPEAILDKDGRLSPEELEVMQRHPVIGARILEPISAFADILALVLQHHEHWDGTGYPAGLAAEDIDPLSRVLAVADVFDACRSDRPYRRGMNEHEAIAIIAQGSGTMFEPRVVEAFLALPSRSVQRCA